MADGYRKFEGFKRRKAPVKLGGAKAALFTIGLIIVGIYMLRVSTNKWSGKTEDSINLDIYECYRPSKEADLSNAKRLVEAMKKEQASECPKTFLSTPVGVVNYGSEFTRHFVTGNVLDGEAKIIGNTSNANPVVGTGGTYDMKEAYHNCYPLIAPFDFTFLNANTDGNTIIIASKDNSYRVTYENVLGWFCASAILDADAVSNHTSHGTVVGQSPNSYVQNGYAGNLVGFGNQKTTIKCEKLEEGQWIGITPEELLGRK